MIFWQISTAETVMKRCNRWYFSLLPERKR